MIRSKRVAGPSALGMALMLVASPALAEWALNMPKGVTDTSNEVYSLHMMILYIVTVIGVLVFGAMIVSIVRHRKSRGNEPAQFHHNTGVEIVWTAIPFAILVLVAIPSASSMIDIYDTSDADMTVRVTGYQWKWSYEYVDEGVSFYSTLGERSNRARRASTDLDPSDVEHYLREVDNRLVLPTNTRIEFEITSADVVHSWWVPDLGWKKDAIPGSIAENWTNIDEPGVYRGKCAELCGRGHAYMPVVVEAVEPETFKDWLAAKKEGDDAAARAALERESTDDAVASR